jgi:3-oxoacyl-[acyl-carrier protein] reductase
LTGSSHWLEGRVALVTGAGRGIGRAIAARFSEEGAAVVVNDLDESVAREAAASIANAVAAAGSVADPSHTDEMVAVAEREFGTLDIVVCNAGLTADSMLHRMTDETWDLVLDVALKGTFYTCRSAARLLRRKDAEHNRKVVNISSINGIYGVAFNTNYSAAKAGVNGLTKALAREWAPLRINVNAVAPGFVETRLTAARGEGDQFGIPPEALEQIHKQIPIGRVGQPEDVAGMVAWLSSPDADYVTGQVVEVHGGLEIVRVG